MVVHKNKLHNDLVHMMKVSDDPDLYKHWKSIDDLPSESFNRLIKIFSKTYIKVNMSDKQKRVVNLMRKKKLNNQANTVEKLTIDQFNKLMDITWNNNLYGTDCYKFLSHINK